MAKDDDRDHEIGRKAAEIEKAAREGRRFRKLDFWLPYPKQLEFINATRLHREVGFFAGTQLGKSETAAFMTACNLTGLYPKFWDGIRYEHAIEGWSVAKSQKMSRDISQAKLIGGLGEQWGTGLIPKHLLIGDPIMGRGESGSIDTIKVRHVSGDISTYRFRTYDAGREALQGATLDWLHLDEEPPLDEYSECLARISARANGRLIITFTPLLGLSGISVRYRQEHSPDRTFVQMGIDDIPPAKDDFPDGGGSSGGVAVHGHISISEREKIVEGYPEHEREARSRGEPMLGEGRVYTAPEAALVEMENHHAWPSYWLWGWGWDPGGGTHPAGATLNCFDPDQKVFHIVAELRMSGATIGQFAEAMRQVEKTLFNSMGMLIPTAYPADAHTRDKQSMTSWVKLLAQENRRMMNEPASLPGIVGQAKFSLEGSVAEIDKWERTGKWKVHARCRNYLEERRTYFRKDNEIVRLRDDVLCAARYAWMMRRKFKTLDDCRGMGGVPGSWGGGGQHGGGGGKPTQFARGSAGHVDGAYDLWNPGGRKFGS
jgi:phage terminase large subunit-like protein